MKNKPIRVRPAESVCLLWSPLDGRGRSGRVADADTKRMGPMNSLTVTVQWNSTEPKQVTISSWHTPSWTKRIDQQPGHGGPAGQKAGARRPGHRR
jgi:hypothetical protein